MRRKSPAESLTRLVAYYDTVRKVYWILDRRNDWIEVTESSLRRHLKASGISPECPHDRLVSELDEALNNFQLDCAVSYAGPLAGYLKGIREVCGNRILVTSSPKLIEPCPGEYPIITLLLRNLFHDDAADQIPILKGWLKVAIEALRAGSTRPGQALAMAGPAQGGKSLFQNLITILLGGRAAKPYRYMSGATQFNGDLFGAEHLMIEDECGSTDIRTRREFGTRIKDVTVNEVQSCHAKNRQALSLRPFWRLSISLNDEPENLMILPPIDESLSDKIILLRAHRHPMPMDTESTEGRSAFWQTLTSEFPAFVHHLLQWQIPAPMRCPRFGVKSFHHPVLLAAIDALSPELRLLSLIDAVLFKELPTAGPHELTAEKLERKLINSDMGYEARRLLSWNNACGTYLGRLATKRPSRVEDARTSDDRNWLIHPGGNGIQ